MELIYIGRKFYEESCTVMSSIYSIDGNRSDWNQVQATLGGENINIRPATLKEMNIYNEKLKNIKKDFKERRI
jgi:hypothetical protein